MINSFLVEVSQVHLDCACLGVYSKCVYDILCISRTTNAFLQFYKNVKTKVLQVHSRKGAKKFWEKTECQYGTCINCISPYLIKAVYFFCGVHRFITSSTGRIHGGAAALQGRNQLPQPSAKRPDVELEKEPSSSPPAGIPVNILTEPPGEEEPGDRRRGLHSCALRTVEIVFSKTNVTEPTCLPKPNVHF